MIEIYKKDTKVGEVNEKFEIITKDKQLKFILSSLLRKPYLPLRTGYEKNGEFFEIEKKVSKQDKEYINALAEYLRKPYFGIIK